MDSGEKQKISIKRCGLTENPHAITRFMKSFEVIG